jgi:hypothetical protein
MTGDCQLKVPACNYLHLANPQVATLRDEHSQRQVTGYYCSKAGQSAAPYVVEKTCSFNETCRNDKSTNDQPTCVACGRMDRKKLTRTVDGKVTEDCQGCQCASFAVSYCIAAGAAGSTCAGEPVLHLFWRGRVTTSGGGADDVSITMSPSGKICTISATSFTPAKVTASARNIKATIAAGGEIEMDVTVDADIVDNFNKPHKWHIEGHVVGECR